MNNSLFVNYRSNLSESLARAMFQNLRANNVNVFIAVENSDAEFETMILNQIAARPYFLLVLMPGTLDRCVEPNDWLLRQIDHAMTLKRVIIPLIVEDFSFDAAKKFLKEPLATELQQFNAVKMPHESFEAAMIELRTDFLKLTDVPVTPTPKADMIAPFGEGHDS